MVENVPCSSVASPSLSAYRSPKLPTCFIRRHAESGRFGTRPQIWRKGDWLVRNPTESAYEKWWNKWKTWGTWMNWMNQLLNQLFHVIHSYWLSSHGWNLHMVFIGFLSKKRGQLGTPQAKSSTRIVRKSSPSTWYWTPPRVPVPNMSKKSPSKMLLGGVSSKKLKKVPGIHGRHVPKMSIFQEFSVVQLPSHLFQGLHFTPSQS